MECSASCWQQFSIIISKRHLTIASIIIFCCYFYFLSWSRAVDYDETVSLTKKDDRENQQSDPKINLETPREPCGHRDM